LLTCPNAQALLRCLVAAAASACLMSAQAQERVYRCGNEYINDAAVAHSRGCLALEGGHITTVHGTRPQRTESEPAQPPRAPQAVVPRTSGERVDSSVQRARDSDARAILEAEWRQALERLGQAQRAYANGEPDKQGAEARNHQRYLDRVAELKAAVVRAHVDVDSLRRELARLGVSVSAGATVPAASGVTAP
jgi:Tfp pilus assembly protein PilE